MNKALSAGRNVIDLFVNSRRSNARPRYPLQASANYCSHCGGWLAAGESEDDCSSAELSNASAPHPFASGALTARR